MQFDQSNRREMITLVGGVVVSWPLAALAQQPAKLVRIGVLASLPLPPLQKFSHKLREYGYVEGQNIRFVSRFAEGRDDRYLALAVELAAVPVDIIVTWGTAAIAAKQATGTIPIV
jgi:putative ABC transport system substrate-binding protein